MASLRTAWISFVRTRTRTAPHSPHLRMATRWHVGSEPVLPSERLLTLQLFLSNVFALLFARSTVFLRDPLRSTRSIGGRLDSFLLGGLQLARFPASGTNTTGGRDHEWLARRAEQCGDRAAGQHRLLEFALLLCEAART
jgi:hypothetical protein